MYMINSGTETNPIWCAVQHLVKNGNHYVWKNIDGVKCCKTEAKKWET